MAAAPVAKVKAKRNQYSYEQLINAFMAVTEEGLTLAEASRRYGVPSRTIGDRVSGRTPLDCMTVGCPSLFTPEQEEALRCHLQSKASIGFGHMWKDVQEMANKYACDLGIRTPGSPLLSKCWLDRFMTRNKIKLRRKPRKLETVSVEVNVRNYFENLQATLIQHRLMDHPERIYSINEKSLTPNIVSQDKLIAIAPPNGSITTVIACGNAVGNSIPPYFVFQGEQFGPDFMERSTPGSSGTVCPAGGANKEVVKTYLKEHFLKYATRINPTRWLLVLYNEHKLHIDIALIEWAKQFNIILFVLPPHTSKFLQPLDVACYRPLESAFVDSKHKIKPTSDGSDLQKADICQYACQAYYEGLKPYNLIAGFKKAGIVPFEGMKVVDPAFFAPSQPRKRPSTTTHSHKDTKDRFVSEHEKVLEEVKRERVEVDGVNSGSEAMNEEEKEEEKERDL